MTERLLGLRRIRQRKWPKPKTPDYSPTADSGLTAPGGFPLTWAQYTARKVAQMEYFDLCYPTPIARLMYQWRQDPNYKRIRP